MTLREQIQSDMKDAMRAHDAAKLSAIRMLWSSVIQSITCIELDAALVGHQKNDQTIILSFLYIYQVIISSERS